MKPADQPAVELAKEYRSFLERLVNDEEFRCEFEREPASVLRREGIPFDPRSLPSRAQLPPREVLEAELRKPLEELSKFGPGGGPYTHSPFSHGFLMPEGD